MSKHPRDRWRMTVIYHSDIDVAEPVFQDVVLYDDEDVDEWERRIREEFARFGRKLDLLINLDGLHVRPGASRHFGEVRARLLEDIATRSFRYGPDLWTATSVNTSRVLFGAAANIFETREAALEALLADRRGGPSAT